MDPREIALMGAQAADEKKADNIVILDMRGLTFVTDFFVICSGTSDKQVRAIADGILEKLKEKEIEPWHTEGYNEATWILLDYGDMVVHVFDEETRQFYDLERLWGDAQRIKLSG